MAHTDRYDETTLQFAPNPVDKEKHFVIHHDHKAQVMELALILTNNGYEVLIEYDYPQYYIHFAHSKRSDCFATQFYRISYKDRMAILQARNKQAEEEEESLFQEILERKEREAKRAAEEQKRAEEQKAAEETKRGE